MSTRENKLIAPTRDTSTNWTANNPLVPEGVLCVETDTGRFKIGNGTNNWTGLSYIGGLTYTGTATDAQILALLNQGDLYIR